MSDHLPGNSPKNLIFQSALARILMGAGATLMSASIAQAQSGAQAAAVAGKNATPAALAASNPAAATAYDAVGNFLNRRSQHSLWKITQMGNFFRQKAQKVSSHFSY